MGQVVLRLQFFIKHRGAVVIILHLGTSVIIRIIVGRLSAPDLEILNPELIDGQVKGKVY